MIYLKRIPTAIFILAAIQTLTYYTISDDILIKEIGKNYESFVLDYEDNLFIDFCVVSEIKPTKRQILDNFKQLSKYELIVCDSISECSDIRQGDDFYIYYQ